jgi:hypothetical protein
MAEYKLKETRDVRLKNIPTPLHQKIIVHQKLMQLKASRIVSLEDAYIDLLTKALQEIPVLNQ